MKKYTLTLVIDPNNEKSESETEKLVTNLSGKIQKKTDLGKKQLAYLIKKKTEGRYLDLELELPPENVKVLKAKLNLMPSVLRYLLLIAH